MFSVVTGLSAKLSAENVTNVLRHVPALEGALVTEDFTEPYARNGLDTLAVLPLNDRRFMGAGLSARGSRRSLNRS